MNWHNADWWDWGKQSWAEKKIQRNKTSHLFGRHELLSLASPPTSSSHPLSFQSCGPLSAATVLLKEDAINVTTESSVKAGIMWSISVSWRREALSNVTPCRFSSDVIGALKLISPQLSSSVLSAFDLFLWQLDSSCSLSSWSTLSLWYKNCCT